ncbi:hypothetical protein MB02_00330 [Croceicoccus estronivorus]|nr:hypothetical protein MB02_00330 [Croceicoccus estronivorus]
MASAEPAANSTPQDVAPAQTEVVTPPVVAPQAATAPAPVNNDPWWRYVLLGLLLFPMGFAAGQFWRHNKGMRKSSFAPTIERPKPRAVPARAAPENDQPAAPEPLPGAFDEELERAEAAQLPPLRHALETTSLSVTLVNALLSYQLTLTNASRQMIRDIRIAGDIVSAHSSQSMEEQLSGPDGNAVLHTVSGLLPGQSIFLNGQLRMPIAAIRPVKREHAMLFIPLIRMRIEAEGLASALVQTCVVGQHPAGPGAGLRPFRLDAGPRVYTEIGQRTLQPAAQAAA